MTDKDDRLLGSAAPGEIGTKLHGERLVEIEFLLTLRSILGNGPCAGVGCEGCACEMQMASDEITDRLKELGARGEFADAVLSAQRPLARCQHVKDRREDIGRFLHREAALSPDTDTAPSQENR